MKKAKKMGYFGIFLILFISLAKFVVPAQKIRPTNTASDTRSTKLAHLEINEIGLNNFFAKLTFEYRIPVALEIGKRSVLKRHYRMSFQDGTVQEFLESFFNKYPGYSWKVQDGVISIYPDHDRISELSDFLDLKLAMFSVQPKMSCWNVQKALFQTAEVTKFLHDNGLTFRNFPVNGPFIMNVGSKFELNVSNESVRSVLNRIASGSSTAKFWVIEMDVSGAINVSLLAGFDGTKSGEYVSLPWPDQH